MAIISRQRQIFEWQELEILGDLERLQLVLKYLPDERLMQHLERNRDRGRDDYPVRAIWNSILAGVIYQHPSVESLRRELLRNSQLRRLCGLAEDKVPTSSAYSRFLNNLFNHEELIEEIFESLVRQCYELLPGFGKHLALDGKAINSHARGRSKAGGKDGRRDLEANYGVKKYNGKSEDGTLWEKVTTWFGYKLHLIVDADYELPVAFSVTPASHSEVKQAHHLVDALAENRPQILETAEYFMADRGYDDGKLIRELWDEHRIKAVIDIRALWLDGEETKTVEGFDNIVYDYRGTVYCCCPRELKLKEMAYGGFEQQRETLKYRCPARHYGRQCKGEKVCPVKKSIRIPLATDRRVFTPLARSSYRWKDQYKKRTAVERVNSRLDVSFGFEQHFIRGQVKMQFRCSLALCIMLAMAIGRVREKQPDLMRSLVKTA
jgi:IS5 family transposase